MEATKATSKAKKAEKKATEEEEVEAEEAVDEEEDMRAEAVDMKAEEEDTKVEVDTEAAGEEKVGLETPTLNLLPEMKLLEAKMQGNTEKPSELQMKVTIIATDIRESTTEEVVLVMAKKSRKVVPEKVAGEPQNMIENMSIWMLKSLLT